MSTIVREVREIRITQRQVVMWALIIVAVVIIAMYAVSALVILLGDSSTYGSLDAAIPAWKSEIAHPRQVVWRTMTDKSLRSTLFATLLFVGCGGFAYIISLHQKQGTPTPASGYGSHGTARWATTEEMAGKFPSAGPGAVLGRLPGRNGGRPVIFPWISRTANKFLLIIGPPGSGKTSRYTLPNLVHAAYQDPHTSIIATDPKGELYRSTAQLMTANGFKVLVVNLIDLLRSLRFNPMDYVHSPEDAQRLAATIIANTEGPHSGGEPFWRNAEEALLACLIWFCKRALPLEQQHLGAVLHLASTFAAEPDLMADTFGEFPPDDPVRRLYGPVAALRDKTRDGVFVGVTASRLKIWASDRICSLTAASDFRIEDLAAEPTVLYLIIPDADPTYRVLSSILFDQVFQQLIILADSAGGRLPHQVRIMLEELANVGRIPDLEKRLGTIRSRGMLCELVLQTLGQLKALYGDAWNTIVGCSDTVLVLGANDQETAEYISRRLGTTTIKTTSTSHTQADRGGSEGMSYQYIGRPLMLPDEVQGQSDGGLDPNELLVIQRGMSPCRIQKYPIDLFPGASQLQPAEPSDYQPPPRGPVIMPDPRSLKPQPPTTTKPGGKPSWLATQGNDKGDVA